MAKLLLAPIESNSNPIEDIATALSTALSEALANSETTTTSVHRGTRVFRLLGLQEEYENLWLVNCYQTTRQELREKLGPILDRINVESEFEVRIVPRGYKVGSLDVSNIAYLLTLAVLPKDGATPEGLIFVQAYSTSRSDASSLKSASSESVDEYEIEDE